MNILTESFKLNGKLVKIARNDEDSDLFCRQILSQIDGDKIPFTLYNNRSCTTLGVVARSLGLSKSSYNTMHRYTLNFASNLKPLGLHVVKQLTQSLRNGFESELSLPWNSIAGGFTKSGRVVLIERSCLVFLLLSLPSSDVVGELIRDILEIPKMSFTSLLEGAGLPSIPVQGEPQKRQGKYAALKLVEETQDAAEKRSPGFGYAIETLEAKLQELQDRRQELMDELDLISLQSTQLRAVIDKLIS